MMKKKLLPLLILPIFLIGCTSQKSYVLNESTFFLVMTNIQYYPEEYVNKDLTFDSFINGVNILDVILDIASFNFN